MWGGDGGPNLGNDRITGVIVAHKSFSDCLCVCVWVGGGGGGGVGGGVLAHAVPTPCSYAYIKYKKNLPP